MRRFCTPGRIVVACKGCIYINLCSAARLQPRTARRMIRSDAWGLVSERISFGSGSALRSSMLTNVGSHARSSRILGTHICMDVQISCSCATCVSTHTALKASWPATNACARAAMRGAALARVLHICGLGAIVCLPHNVQARESALRAGTRGRVSDTRIERVRVCVSRFCAEHSS